MIVVSDTGVIIAFAKIRKLNILKSIFGKIFITTVVHKELMAKLGDEGEEIDQALNEFVNIVNISKSLKERDTSVKELGLGERQSIEYAYSNITNTILLIDDKAGRRVAKRLKIKTIGTMGVLIVAKKRGLIENVTNIITEMRENGYWLSDSIIETTKRLAGESGDKRET